mgnify:CR=1 FL=1
MANIRGIRNELDADPLGRDYGTMAHQEAALCDARQDSLPSRSRDDTDQTIADIGHAYDVFEAVCKMEL